MMDKKGNRKMNRLKWLFNPLMIWGAVLDFLIFGALGQIRDAWHHTGSGYVSYEQPDRTVKVEKNEYKRHEYATGGMMLFLGLFTWILVAKDAKNSSKKTNNRDE
jgi:hypothetical protein